MLLLKCNKSETGDQADRQLCLVPRFSPRTLGTRLADRQDRVTMIYFAD